jgi:chitin disaccharide deacetylase
MALSGEHGGDRQAAAIRLMVHADDFGLSAAANQGVWRAHREGIVTAASVVANGAALEEALKLAAGSNLALGLHLNLTSGRPLLPAARVPSLVNRSGLFPSKWALARRALSGQLSISDVTAEISAQLDRLMALGVPPTHLDSYHHVHLIPALARCIAPIMGERGIFRIRRVAGPGECTGWSRADLSGRLQHRTLAMASRLCESEYGLFAGADAFFGFGWYLSRNHAAALGRLLLRLQPGNNEWMCHPADFGVGCAKTAAEVRRQSECDILCADSTRRALGEAGIELITMEK